MRVCVALLSRIKRAGQPKKVMFSERSKIKVHIIKVNLVEIKWAVLKTAKPKVNGMVRGQKFTLATILITDFKMKIIIHVVITKNHSGKLRPRNFDLFKLSRTIPIGVVLRLARSPPHYKRIRERHWFIRLYGANALWKLTIWVLFLELVSL